MGMEAKEGGQSWKKKKKTKVCRVLGTLEYVWSFLWELRGGAQSAFLYFCSD